MNGEKGTWRRPPTSSYKPRDPAITSRMMARVGAKHSVAEMLLRRELWRRGFRYRLHAKNLPGRPDIVFRGRRVAVFVDSDWWHGRILIEEGEDALRAHLRTARQDWWVQKLRRNVARDQEVTAELRANGWQVIRFWESTIKANVDVVANDVEHALRGAGTT